MAEGGIRDNRGQFLVVKREVARAVVTQLVVELHVRAAAWHLRRDLQAHARERRALRPFIQCAQSEREDAVRLADVGHVVAVAVPGATAAARLHRIPRRSRGPVVASDLVRAVADLCAGLRKRAARAAWF